MLLWVGSLILFASPVAQSAEGPELPAELGAALHEIERLRADGQLEVARAGLESVFDGGAYAQLLTADHDVVALGLDALDEAAKSLSLLSLLETVRAERVARLSARLEPDHLDLLAARANLAVVLFELGELQRALELEEDVHAARVRVLPRDHALVLLAKQNLAVTRRTLGDLEGALVLEEEVLAARRELLPADHPALLAAQLNLAGTLQVLGDLERARPLLETVHDARERLLPADHPHLLGAKQNLGVLRLELGDLEGAHALFEHVHAIFEDVLPEDHPQLLSAMQNLALTSKQRGDLSAALVLEERVHDARERALPADHPELIDAKAGLAITLHRLRELERARALEEYVLEARERTLPEDHPDLLAARQNLAGARLALGDLEGALVLNQSVHDAYERLLPGDHPVLLEAKGNLAGTLKHLGRLERALSLEESVHAVREAGLADGHPALLTAKANLATTHSLLGNPRAAVSLQETVLGFRAESLPPGHPDLLSAMQNLARTYGQLGELERALPLQESVSAARAELLPDGHPSVLSALENLAFLQWQRRDTEALLDLTQRILAHQMLRAEALRLESQRIARAGGVWELSRLASPLSFTAGAGEAARALDSDLFSVLEALRLASTSSSEIALAAGRFPELGPTRERLARVRGELNDRSLTAPADPAGLAAWRRDIVELSEERDAMERKLRAELSKKGIEMPRPTGTALAHALAPDSALVSFFHYPRMLEPGSRLAADSLVAFVVAPGAGVRRIELGPAGELEALAASWRSSLGRPLEPTGAGGPASAPARGVGVGTAVAATGVEWEEGRNLCARLVEPCLAALGDDLPVSLHVVLDDFLHLVPIEALPWGEGRRLGEVLELRLEISTRRLTRARAGESRKGTLVAVGGVDFGAVEVESPGTSRTAVASLPLSGDRGAGRGFDPLPHTTPEIRALAALYEHHERAEPNLLEGSDATKRALHDLAPDARFLHVATHGWFAPESFRSMIDAGRGHAAGSGETLRGFAPETLCGLALAGANRGADERGEVPGILTAEELATLDLSSCELAVLSACETNVGIRRAGQGIQSLQAALHTAGARTAITSLWRVEDAATRRLMELFYAKLWEDGLGVADALWQAKMALRGEGYPVRDWAGWVLTGAPD